MLLVVDSLVLLFLFPLLLVEHVGAAVPLLLFPSLLFFLHALFRSIHAPAPARCHVVGRLSRYLKRFASFAFGFCLIWFSHVVFNPAFVGGAGLASTTLTLCTLDGFPCFFVFVFFSRLFAEPQAVCCRFFYACCVLVDFFFVFTKCYVQKLFCLFVFFVVLSFVVKMPITAPNHLHLLGISQAACIVCFLHLLRTRTFFSVFTRWLLW